MSHLICARGGAAQGRVWRTWRGHRKYRKSPLAPVFQYMSAVPPVVMDRMASLPCGGHSTRSGGTPEDRVVKATVTPAQRFLTTGRENPRPAPLHPSLMERHTFPSPSSPTAGDSYIKWREQGTTRGTDGVHTELTGPGGGGEQASGTQGRSG